MECGDNAGRNSWDWVGPPAWGRGSFNSPEWGDSSPVKTEPPQIVLLLLLSGYIILKEQLLLDRLTSAIFFFVHFRL